MLGFLYLQAGYVDTLVGSLQLTARLVKLRILITAAAGELFSLSFTGELGFWFC